MVAFAAINTMTVTTFCSHASVRVFCDVAHVLQELS